MTAIELIAESGIRNFSLAEASRRLGVTVSAPYAHFADRDDLLAAVAVHALGLFSEYLEPALASAATPQDRLETLVRAYVRFAAAHQTLFWALFAMRLDKARHPELTRADRPIELALRASVRGFRRRRHGATEEALAAMVEAVAHGHATLLLDGRFGHGNIAVTRAADSAARAALGAVQSWDRVSATIDTSSEQFGHALPAQPTKRRFERRASRQTRQRDMRGKATPPAAKFRR